MSQKSQKIQQNLQKFAGKISDNLYLKSLSQGIMSTLPVLIIGAFSSLLSNLNFEPYQNFITSTGLVSIFNAMENMTMNIIAIYAVFFIAFKLVENIGENASVATGGGLIALVSFMVLTPIIQVDEANVIPFQFLGAAGLFVAIIVGLVAARFYVFILKRGWTIKLPEGVPPTVSSTFANIVPAAIVVLLFAILGLLFEHTSYGSVHQMVYTFIQTPLENLGGTYWSMVVFIFVLHGLWFFGVHGGLVVQPILLGVWLPLGVANLNAISAGEEPTNILHAGFHATFISLGGAGAGLGLCLAILIFAKSKRYKALGKLALPGSLFGINEPLLFGMPIVLNPYMLIPFITAPLINASLVYFLMSTGIIPLTNGFFTPLGTPIFVDAALQGSLIFILVQVVLIIISTLIYYPFVKKIDRDAYQEEINEKT